MRKGFTLIELLVFIGIFSITMIGFIAIFVTVTRVQTRQTAQSEVEQQSQFLLQQMQYYIGTASLVEIPQDTATTTLKLRTANSSTDPTYITISSGTIYVQQGSGVQGALTSNRVTVSNLSFTKRSNVPSRDAVQISFMVSYNTQNLTQAFSQAFQTSVARVSAATFDSDVFPSSTATYKLGLSGQIWLSINDMIYFSGSNVGIGVASPAQTLEVNGGVRLHTSTSKPSCTSAQRGTFWVTESSAGVQDAVEVCAKSAADTYAWRTIY